MRLSTITLLFIIFLWACSAKESREIESQEFADTTDQINESAPTEETHSTPSDDRAVYEVQFEREQTFSSTDEVIIGDIATFTVDDSNHVYIADGDKTTIHVFNPDGSYLKNLGRRGNGPGEFAELNRYTTMTFHSNRLFVTDFYADVPKGVQIFLPEELSFSHTIKLVAENRNDYAKLQGYLPKRFFPLNDGTFLVSYRHSDEYEEKDKTSFVYYVIQDDKGHIVSGPVLKQKGLTYLVHEHPGGYMHLMHSFPFHGKSLLAVSGDDQLFTAWTGDFKIDVYNSEGQQVRTIQHPFDNIVFDKDQVIKRYEETNYMWRLGDGVALKMIREANNLPERWPALETIFFDDEDRLWAATIVEDFDIYEWWVLEKTGEVIKKFEWPRDEPIEAANNDFMYTRETDEETGVQEIVRYRILWNNF